MRTNVAALFTQPGAVVTTRVSVRARERVTPSSRPLAQLACLILFLLLSAGAAEATTLQTYREQVRKAVLVLDALPQWKKVESHADYSRRVAAAVEQLRMQVLPVEAIEWNGMTLSVDNKWLDEALARYEQLPAANVDGRAAELAQVTDRLRAVNERLSELQAEAAGASKSEEKKKLEAILQRTEYSDKQDEDGALKRLWRRINEWLRNLFPKSKGLAPGATSTLSGFAQFFVIALALAVIAYIVWKFTPLLRRARTAGKREKMEARIVLGERLEADQTAADLLAEAEALARRGELRAAIRKGYIALLCELGDRKIIGLAEHKTNRDYLRAVREIEPLHAQMKQLTLSFENHWYGFVPATENDWHAFRSGFQRAVTSGE
jgi:hypothetical protein